MLRLDEHDQRIVNQIRDLINVALQQSHQRSAVAKRLVTIAVGHRNRGRRAAMARYPFAGICEASGQPLDYRDAVLDELDPEIGYSGRVRWVCQRANNSGKRSCGHC